MRSQSAKWKTMQWRLLVPVVVLIAGLGLAGVWLLSEGGETESPHIDENAAPLPQAKRPDDLHEEPTFSTPQASPDDVEGTKEPAPDGAMFTTSELLDEMKRAYLAADNRRLSQLRAAALQRDDLEVQVVRIYYRTLVRGIHDRHDDQPTLENAVADVLLHAWPVPEGGEAEWQHGIFQYAAEVMAGNRFREFDGRWQEGHEGARQAGSPRYQRDHFVRPERDVDTEAIEWLIGRSLAKSGFMAYDQEIPLVTLFSPTKDYVEDRLAFMQSYVCGLLVKLNAVQHLDDLWKLATNAIIRDVQGVALKAFIQLGGTSALVDLGDKWSRMIADSESRSTVLSQVEALARSDLDMSTLIYTTRIVFEMLDSAGIDWHDFALAFEWNRFDAFSVRGTKDSQMLRALQGEDSPAMLATWAGLLSMSFAGTNDPVVLEALNDRLHAVLTERINIRNSSQRNYVISALTVGYNNVTSLDRKGQVLVPFLKDAYGVSRSSGLFGLDQALLRQVNIIRIMPTGASVPFQESVAMLETAMARLLPLAEGDRHLRGVCIEAWAILQVNLAHERLSVLLAEARTDFARELYTDAIVEWQKEADRRASGG
jgi:hypothetical protein